MSLEIPNVPNPAERVMRDLFDCFLGQFDKFNKRPSLKGLKKVMTAQRAMLCQWGMDERRIAREAGRLTVRMFAYLKANEFRNPTQSKSKTRFGSCSAQGNRIRGLCILLEQSATLQKSRRAA